MLHTGRNIFSLVLSRVLSGVILFLVYTRLVQYLGPEAAGQFGLLAAFLTVFNFFVDLGMSQLVIKKISEDKNNAGKYLTNFFGIQFLLGLLFMLIMDAIVLLGDYPPIVKNALYVTAFSLLVTSLSLPFRAVIISFQKLTINAKVNFANAMVNSLMMALAIVLKLNVFYLSFIAVAVGLFDLVLYAIVVHRRFTPFKFDFDKQFIKLLFVWNLPFTLLTLFSIYNRIDGLLLPHLRDFTENGYYSAAYKFWDTLAFVPGVIGISLYPYFADILNRGLLMEVRKGLETYSRYMIAIAMPLVVGGFLLAEPLTVAFFGPEFRPAAPALWLLVAAVSVLFVYTPANSLMVSRLTKTATIITGCNLMFNVVANLVFIPIYGFVAAAAITLVSELIQFIGYTYFIKRRVVGFSIFRYMIKPVLASGVMALVLWSVSGSSVWLSIAAGTSAYGIVLLLLKFFHKEDWEMFKHAVSVKQGADPEIVT